MFVGMTLCLAQKKLDTAQTNHRQNHVFKESQSVRSSNGDEDKRKSKTDSCLCQLEEVEGKNKVRRTLLCYWSQKDTYESECESLPK